MSNGSQLNRRRLIAIGGSAMIAGIAGCSGDGGNSTPSDDSTSPTATEESNTATDADTASTATPTESGSESEASSETPEPASGYLIDSLSEYRTVTNNPDEWVGEQIAANDVSYYDSYQEEYEGFRALYNNEKVARPFMLKNVQPRDNADEFLDGEQISFEGTVEEIGDVQGTKIILVEDVAVR